MSDRYVLAYDFGTSGVKTVLVNEKAEILALTMAAYSMITPKVGWAEQDTDEYWQAIVKTTVEVLKKSNISKDSICALAFSCQSMGIIPIDKNGNILHNNISWVDGRAEKQAEKINALVGSEIVGGKDVISKLLWLKEERPDIFSRTKYIMDVNGYLRYKATGVIAAEYTGASSYGLDLEKKYWLKDLYECAGVGIDKFPPLVKSTDTVGGLTKKAAEELHLNEGTLVFGGCDDVQAAAIGAGTMEEGEGHIYLGSSAWLCVSTQKAYDIAHGAGTVKSADPDMNVIIGVTQSAGMTLNWAIDKYYRQEREDASVDEYGCIEKEMGAIKPGADRLIVTPWIFGEYCPITSESVRATMFNITNMHTRAHILKAIHEGIAYNLRWTKENYKRDFGADLSALRVVGGGGLSEEWMQILADVMQVTIQVTTDMRHAGAIGAAVCALVGLGVYDGFNCIKDIIKVKKEYLPRNENGEIYDLLFKEYQEIYYALKDSYERINRTK